MPAWCITEWEPGSLAALSGGVELYRSEPLELRAGDRVRWTRDDPFPGLPSGRPARVEAVGDGHVLFRLADRTTGEPADADPRLRHLERAWASPPGAPQPGKARHLVAAVDSSDPDLATGEGLYGGLGGVAGRARLVTDSAARLADLLEAATGERVEALEATAGQSSPA